MNILVVGQGAMGLLWYHHILQLLDDQSSSNQLHLLASNTPKNCYEQYTFTDQNNIEHHGNVNYAQVKHIEMADTILLCLKSFQISSALKEISCSLKTKVNIILAHNGMGTLNDLPKSVINNHDIYTLLTTHGCLRTAPLTITHTGIGSTDIGLVSGKADLKQQQALAQLLNTALPNVNYHQEIKQKQWLKLAINCVINPLTAINNINNGKINNAEYLQKTAAILQEVVSVAAKEDVLLDLDTLKKTVKNVAQATASNSSSMRCDVLANRMTEIEYINGYIHRLGIEHKIATPENTMMWQTVKYI